MFDCKPQNIVAVVVQESATAQEAVPLDGVAAQAKRETVITFLELSIPKKSETRASKSASCGPTVGAALGKNAASFNLIV